MLGKLLPLGLLLLHLVHAQERTTAPAGCITVARSGGQFTTFQSAVNSLSTTSTTAQCIFISAGTYTEQVFIPARSAQLTIFGSTTDITTYTGNQATVTFDLSQENGLTDDGTATIRAFSEGLRIYNLNIANTFGMGSQAVALSAEADMQGFYGVKLTGYQDTLLAETGHQFYGNSFIEGAVDFIFGQTAIAWFENVDINVIGPGTITADGRDSATNPSYYVINESNIGGTAGAGETFLGRPWSNFSRVAFQNTEMSNVVNSAGWKIWNVGDERTNHVVYEEFGNTGAGATGPRASFSTMLSAALQIGNIMGDVSWVDSSFL